MRRVAAGSMGIALVAALGCGGRRPPAATTRPAPAGPEPPRPVAGCDFEHDGVPLGETLEDVPPVRSFEVIDRGSEPRSELRYHLAPGAVLRQQVTTWYRSSIAPPERMAGWTIMPSRTYQLVSQVVGVAPNGTARIRTAVEGFHDDSDHALIEPGMAQPDGTPIEASWGRDLVAHDGGPSGGGQVDLMMDVQGGIAITSRTSEDLVPIVKILTQLTLPLPVEPVGVGARWTAWARAPLLSVRVDVEYAGTRNGHPLLVATLRSLSGTGHLLRLKDRGHTSQLSTMWTRRTEMELGTSTFESRFRVWSLLISEVRNCPDGELDVMHSATEDDMVVEPR